MIARVSVRSIGFFSPLRRIVIWSCEFTGPRILSTASESVSPWIDVPSIVAIRSPVLIPAFAAGVPSIGEITLTRPSSIVTSRPSPPYSPRVDTCMSEKFFGFR